MIYHKVVQYTYSGLCKSKYWRTRFYYILRISCHFHKILWHFFSFYLHCKKCIYIKIFQLNKNNKLHVLIIAVSFFFLKRKVVTLLILFGDINDYWQKNKLEQIAVGYFDRTATFIFFVYALPRQNILARETTLAKFCKGILEIPLYEPMRCSIYIFWL